MSIALNGGTSSQDDSSAAPTTGKASVKRPWVAPALTRETVFRETAAKTYIQAFEAHRTQIDSSRYEGS